jgi:hypothetical protein
VVENVFSLVAKVGYSSGCCHYCSSRGIDEGLSLAFSVHHQTAVCLFELPQLTLSRIAFDSTRDWSQGFNVLDRRRQVSQEALAKVLRTPSSEMDECGISRKRCLRVGLL